MGSIKKINEFVTSQLGRQVVVCCRTKVYEASGVKLEALNGALRIQPLAISQVQDYFERVNPEIWEALQDETGLGELLKPPESGEECALLQIPLFLQILAIAYQPDKMIASKSELLDAYIARRLSLKVRKADRRLARKKEMELEWAYKTVEQEPNVKTAICYLSWLARKLNENNVPNVFLIEDMQPWWLASPREQNQYRQTMMVMVALIFVLVSSLFLSFTAGVVPGLISAWLYDWMGMMSVIRPVEKLDSSKLFAALKEKTRLLKLFLKVSALIYLLVGWVAFFIAFKANNLTTSFIFYFTVDVLIDSLAILVMLAISVSIASTQVSFKVRSVPNQGIRASVRNFVVITLMIYPIAVLTSSLFSFSLISKWPFAISDHLESGMALAIIVGLQAGSVAFVQHSVLRLTLHRQGHIPHNYAKFLKYTTERRLTQQVGGSFRFIHRELLDHFAAMDLGDTRSP